MPMLQNIRIASDEEFMTDQSFNPKALRVKDVVAIIVLFFCCFIILIVSASYLGSNRYVRWAGLISNSVVLFAWFIGRNRACYRDRTFWQLGAICLFLHLSVFIVLTSLTQWKLGWFLVMYLEMPLLERLKERFVGPRL
jgi:hypothetical protein